MELRLWSALALLLALALLHRPLHRGALSQALSVQTQIFDDELAVGWADYR